MFKLICVNDEAGDNRITSALAWHGLSGGGLGRQLRGGAASLPEIKSHETLINRLFFVAVVVALICDKRFRGGVHNYNKLVS